MNYMGGKFRQGPAIARHVSAYLREGSTYVEPFCGAWGTASRIMPIAVERGVAMVVLSDCNEALVNMWKALLDGWMPPDVVTEDTHNHHKGIRDPNDPMTAYCGFGMSFGSKLWGGYARNGCGTDCATSCQRSTALKVATIRKTIAVGEIPESIQLVLKRCDYRDAHPGPAVFYMDPPYAGRTKAHGVKFDSEAFWAHCNRLVSEGNTVLVTEFSAPLEWIRVHNFGDTVVRHYSGKGKDGTCESIFMHQSQAGSHKL